MPEFYLNRFTTDGLLWVYDRGLGEYRRQQPLNTTVRTHYYTAQAATGEKNAVFEQWLSRVEGDAKPLMDKLEAGGELDTRERPILAYFLATLFYRLPRREREMGELATSFGKMLLRRNLLHPATRRNYADPDKLLRTIERDDVTLTPNRNVMLVTMRARATPLAQDLVVADWNVAHAPRGCSFVTGDGVFGLMPTDLSRQTHRPYGIASPEVATAVALSPNTCLLLHGLPCGMTHFIASREEVRQINLAILRETERYALARDEAQLRSLVRAANISRPEQNSRMVVDELPHPSLDPMRSFTIVHRKPLGQK